MEIHEAFLVIRSSLEKKKKDLQSQGSMAFQNGNMENIQKITDQIKIIDLSNEQLDKIESMFSDSGFSRSKPTLKAIPLIQSKSEKRTQEEPFIIPILSALVEFGGKSTNITIKSRVGEMMKGVLTKSDYDIVSGGKPAWWSRCGWARLELVHQGYMRSDSRTGIWEITDDGRKYLEKNLQYKTNKLD